MRQKAVHCTLHNDGAYFRQQQTWVIDLKQPAQEQVKRATNFSASIEAEYIRSDKDAKRLAWV